MITIVVSPEMVKLSEIAENITFQECSSLLRNADTQAIYLNADDGKMPNSRWMHHAFYGEEEKVKDLYTVN
jgi:hypothetical protein